MDKLSDKTIEELKKVGVYLQVREPVRDKVGNMFEMDCPLCMIWYGSEEPTKEEMTLLEQFPKRLAERYYPECVHDYCVEGVNTITLKKENGQWTYKRKLWEIWYQNSGPLESIKKEIFERKFVLAD